MFKGAHIKKPVPESAALGGWPCRLGNDRAIHGFEQRDRNVVEQPTQKGVRTHPFYSAGF